MCSVVISIFYQHYYIIFFAVTIKFCSRTMIERPLGSTTNHLQWKILFPQLVLKQGWESSQMLDVFKKFRIFLAMKWKHCKVKIILFFYTTTASETSMQKYANHCSKFKKKELCVLSLFSVPHNLFWSDLPKFLDKISQRPENGKDWSK